MSKQNTEKAWAYCHECGYQGDVRPSLELAEYDVRQHDVEHHSASSFTPETPTP